MKNSCLLRLGPLKLFLLGKYRVCLWVYALAVTAAELVVTFINPVYGAVCHLVLFFALLVYATATFQEEVKAAYLSMLLAPLVRIMSLSLPLVKMPPVYWYLVISIPLFAAAASVIRLAGLKLHSVGLTAGGIPLQILVAFLGIPIGFLEYQILKPAPLIAEMTPQQIWLPALILLFCTGFLEELIFRGVMFRSIADNFGSAFAGIHVSLVFAVMHIYYHSFFDAVFVFVVALCFTAIVNVSRSIVGVSLAHGFTNICLYLVFPFLK